jgi:hypothetical protein
MQYLHSEVKRRIVQEHELLIQAPRHESSLQVSSHQCLQERGKTTGERNGATGLETVLLLVAIKSLSTSHYYNTNCSVHVSFRLTPAAALDVPTHTQLTLLSLLGPFPFHYTTTENVQCQQGSHLFNFTRSTSQATQVPIIKLSLVPYRRQLHNICLVWFLFQIGMCNLCLL